MNYSPKLKKAMEEINAVIKKHDIAAFVVLHRPGFVEYVNKINPSYSCAFLEEGNFRVRLKEAEVGKERAKQLAHDTYNMAKLMSDIIGMHGLGYMEFEEMLRKHWGGESGPGTHTSHESQNN